MTPHTPDAWLDPDCDDVEFPHPALVAGSDLERLGRLVMGEPLVAQRLITAGMRGLGLNADSADSAASEKPEQWGHSLTSAVAVLLPPLGEGTSQADRRKRRKYQEQLLKGQANWPDLASTASNAYLLCMDNQPPEIGLPAQLYPGRTPEELLEFDGFYALLQELIRTVSPAVAPAWMHTKTGLREALTTIVAETFKNTHDHARHEVDRSDVAQSLRGIYARFYSLSEISSLAQERRPEEHSPALRFARSFIPKPSPPGVRRPQTVPVNGVLEISVFDSGPGMAAKWLRRSVDGVPVQEQLEALLSCFAKGRTTTGTLGRGYGLAKVLMRLKDLHGFIGVRTNQVHVFRQFGTALEFAHKELQDGTRVPEEKLFDWKRHVSSVASQRLSVRGTVVSFLLPMGGE